MVNAQEWLDSKYPTAEAKAAVTRIGPKEDKQTTIENGLTSLFTRGRDPILVLQDIMNQNQHQIEDNLNLEGPLSLKGFVNLEELIISNQKITALDVSNCSKLRELICDNNQLSNLNLSKNRQLELVGCTGNQLTNLDLTGLTKIEKIFCSGNKLKDLKFLESLNPTRVLSLRMDNNQFPAQDLSCFTRFVNLRRLYVSGNAFYGSLKPLRNLNNLQEISVVNTEVDSGIEYLPENFFNDNANLSKLGIRGGYFARTLECTGKLAEQLKGYKVEGDPLRNYNLVAWREHNQHLINKANANDEDTKNQEIIQAKIAKVKQVLNEINSSLSPHQETIEQLSAENQQLQNTVIQLKEQVTSSSVLQLTKEQLTKNELGIKEKKQIIGKLSEEVKQLEKELSKLQV